MNTLKYTNNSELNSEQILKYLLVIWMIITSGGIAIIYNQFVLTVTINLLIIIVLYLKPKNKIVLNKSIFIYLYVLFSSCIVHLLLTIADHHIYYGGLLILEVLLMCVCIYEYMGLEEMMRIYTKIILVIACVSLVGYFFQTQIILHYSWFPKLVIEDNIYINLYIYIINSAVPERNCGIFWEPGAFQVFLNLAVAFTLFNNQSRQKWIIVMISVLTIVSTISTNGLAALFLIFIGYVVSRKMKNKFKVIFTILLSTLIMLSYRLDTIVKSLQYKFGVSTRVLSSNFTSRYNPFILDLMIIKKNLLGIMGVDYYSEILNNYSSYYYLPYISSSCTHTMIGVAFGVPFMLLALWGLFKFSCEIGNNTLSKMLFFVAIILMFSGESFLLYPIYYFMILCGLVVRSSKNPIDRRMFNGEKYSLY